MLALALTLLTTADCRGGYSVDDRCPPTPAAPPIQRPQPRPLPPNQLGYGDPVTKDARITVHFTARTADGKTIADTEARGMAFTFLMDQETVEPFWHNAVRGLRTGGIRTVTMPASSAGVTLSGDPVLNVTVRLVKVAPL